MAGRGRRQAGLLASWQAGKQTTYHHQKQEIRSVSITSGPTVLLGSAALHEPQAVLSPAEEAPSARTEIPRKSVRVPDCLSQMSRSKVAPLLTYVSGQLIPHLTVLMPNGSGRTGTAKVAEREREETESVTDAY